MTAEDLHRFLLSRGHVFGGVDLRGSLRDPEYVALTTEEKLGRVVITHASSTTREQRDACEADVALYVPMQTTYDAFAVAKADGDLSAQIDAIAKHIGLAP